MTVTVAQCAAEIQRLHDFFQAWFTGSVPNDAANFQAFHVAMDEEFTIIGPDGQLREMSALSAGLRAAYGKEPTIRIWTEQCQLLRKLDDTILCTYEEWQQITTGDKQETTARLSTVLFRRVAAAPHGLAWLHVHETWLRGAS